MQGRYTLIAIALFCLLTVAAAAQDQDGYDFRKTKWGMTPAQVKASEGKEPIGDGQTGIYHLVLYTGSVAGLDVHFGYRFIDNKLVTAGYIFQNSYTNKNQYILDYKKIQDILTRKYGPPSKNDIVWNNDLYKDDIEDYGTAVSIGHLIYQSDWQTPTTEIRLTLRGENFKVSMGVAYTDIKSKSLIESLEKKSVEEDF